jgi:hypothetical protein
VLERERENRLDFAFSFMGVFRWV